MSTLPKIIHISTNWEKKITFAGPNSISPFFFTDRTHDPDRAPYLLQKGRCSWNTGFRRYLISDISYIPRFLQTFLDPWRSRCLQKQYAIRFLLRNILFCRRSLTTVPTRWLRMSKDFSFHLAPDHFCPTRGGVVPFQCPKEEKMSRSFLCW